MVKSLTYWDVKSHIKSGKIAGVYLFSGEEIFLIRSIEEEIKNSLVPKESVHFNFDVFFAEEANFVSVLDSVKTLPFMSAKRMIIVKNVEKFSSFEEELITFLSTSVNNVCLILETNKKLEDKFIKKIAKYAIPVAFPRLQGVGLRKWVADYVLNNGKRIAPGAVELLIENAGIELDALINSLDKLCTYSLEEKTISEASVEALVGKTTTDTRFALVDALVQKKADRALIIANELSRDGKQATDIIGLINWQLKRIESVKQLAQKGCSQETMSRKLKMSPYIVNIVKKQAARFSFRELDKDLRLLLDSDIAIKQGLKPPLLALETLIVRICTEK
ncbi:MAG: DNA polymerase III subunit delta [Candidatus Omnitrophota bacterium]